MLAELLQQAQSSERDARLQALEEMSEVFARGKWTNDEAIPVVTALVAMAQTEDDPETLEVILHDLVSAYDCRSDLPVSLAPLVPVLDRLDETLLDYALHLLGQTRQMQFFPVLDRFTSDPREAVRESAESAVNELLGRSDD